MAKETLLLYVKATKSTDGTKKSAATFKKDLKFAIRSLATADNGVKIVVK